MAYETDYSKIDPTQLNVFFESRKRRVFVGTLRWDSSKNFFEFKYDPKYASSKKAIPVGRELDLFKKIHTSRGKLFPSFTDRIPSRQNPAYEDYCRSQGVSVEEKNPIILLISIGRKGPSTFIFEPIVKNEFGIEEIKSFRKKLDISINDMAMAFDLNQVTLQRLETGKKADIGTTRRIQIYLTFPKVSMWQLSLTRGRLHSDTFYKLWAYFESQSKKKNKEKDSQKRI